MKETVNHPEHYNWLPNNIEAIEILQNFNFNIGSCMKYLIRAGKKSKDTYVEDLQKAKKYIEFEIERVTNS